MSVPEPPSEPPEIENEETVSLNAATSSAPEVIETADKLPSRSAVPRATVPPETVRSPVSVPASVVVPADEVAAPVPRLALTVPPPRA